MVRVTGHIMHGEFLAAFRTNPLDTAFLLLFVPIALAALVLNRTLGWRLDLELSAVERRLAWAALAVVAVVNWTYVLWSGI